MKEQPTINQLKAELEEAKASIAMLNARLLESEQLKSHFISNVMNEVYNPFTAILSLSESLGKLNEVSLEKVKRMAGLIHHEALQLDFQLQNIFAAAQIEAGTCELQAELISLVEVVNEAIAYLKPQFEKKGQDLIHVDSDKNKHISLINDSAKLRLILINILSNAIKFSEANQDIRITIVKTGEELSIEIEDKGKGIPKEKLNLIFDSFKKLDLSIKSDQGGYGLGLAVSKAYAEYIGSDFQITSKDDQGTNVRLILRDLSQDAGASIESRSSTDESEMF